SVPLPAARKGPEAPPARARHHRRVRPATRRGRGVRRAPARSRQPGRPEALLRHDPRLLRHGPPPDKGSRGNEGSRERAPRGVRTALTRARLRPCGGTPQLPPARVAEDAGAEAAPPPASAPQPPASARNRRRRAPSDLLRRQVLLVGR